jgi:peptidoglycan lytic transglycosylase G
VAAASSPAMIRDLDPQAPTLEGYLFPNTYRLSRKTTPERLCRIMTAKFRDAWKSLQTTAKVHDTLTLASLVEREGKLAEERPQIAAVFTNRLRIGMRLDCDPTTIYAAILQKHYNGAIHRSDLDSDHPYNTYRHAGLPPGPIANPGLASIRAALEPADIDALYFVARADHSGAHEFSSNIAAHEKAVDRYRRGLRQ